MSIKMLQGQAQMINSDLEFITKEIHAPKKNIALNEKEIKDAKKLLGEALERQKDNIKFYENDKKRYKALKRYGDVLILVEKLLGLIPSDLSNLSLEELEEKLKEHLKTRKRNEMQMAFIFYQNLITDLMTNLLTIEKDFQEGKISSQQAYKNVKTAKQEIKEHALDMPTVLQPAVEEASHLVKLYENSYEKMDVKQSSNEQTTLKDTDVKLKHQVMFDNLNLKTKEIISEVTGLSTDLSKFEPQVDLSALTNNLKDTHKILETENFDVNNMNSAVADLENTTLSLTSKQLELNKENNSLVSRINDCSHAIIESSQLSMKEISRETFINMSERAETNETTLGEIKDLVEDEGKTPLDIGSQTANTIIAQIDADKEFANKLATDPNVEISALQLEKLEKSEDVAELLNSDILTLEEKQNLILTLEIAKEEKDPKASDK